MGIFLKHVTEDLNERDGLRYLVCDRLPERCSELNLDLAGWIKELSPGSYLEEILSDNITEEQWKKFRRLYYRELISPEKEPFLNLLAEKAKNEDITLFFVEPDRYRNHAFVLKTIIELRIKAEQDD